MFLRKLEIFVDSNNVKLYGSIIFNVNVEVILSQKWQGLYIGSSGV